MADYEKAIRFTLKWEGGYVNDGSDRGKETYRGISRYFNPDWDGWDILDNIPNKRYNQQFPQLEDEVKAFYKEHYWHEINADKICNDKIAAFIFDWYVNSGNNAIKKVQKITKQKQDGVLGNVTLYAINNYNGGLYEPLKMERISYYKSIVKNNPSQAKFLKGWLNRVESFDKDFA